MENKKLKWEWIGKDKQEHFTARALFLIERNYIDGDKDNLESVAKRIYYAEDESDLVDSELRKKYWQLMGDDDASSSG